MDYEIKCSLCGQTSANLLNFKCPKRGQPLELQTFIDFKAEKIIDKDYTLWRYAQFSLT
jgi:transcription initiation factor IIE alpha subunit